MADGDLELSRRLQEYAQVMEYAQEVLQILTSPDFLAEGRKAGQKAATNQRKDGEGTEHNTEINPKVIDQPI